MKRWLLVIFLALPAFASAQTLPKDTTGIYRSIYEYSKDKKLVYFFYRALFNVPSDPVQVTHDIRDNDDERFHEMSGMKIRSIRVETYEPFGTSLSDTTVQPHSLFQKAGNALHFRTRTRIIRNYLLFEEGDQLDPLMLSESERLLRASGFVRDVFIEFVNEDTLNCEVDVVVRSRDLWTFSATTTLTTERIRPRITGYNMFGLGHRFSNRFTYRYKDSPDEFPDVNGYYRVPNISNTFITSELFYSFEDDEKIRGVTVDRPFYSPTTRWAGGVSYTNTDLYDSLDLDNPGYEPYRYISGEWSVWGGRSYVLRKGRTPEEKSTRLITSLSYTRTRYNRLEVFSDEAASRFVSSDLYLAGIGISNRKYFTDRYIFRFGEKEDVPTGRLLKTIGGIEKQGVATRYYMQIGLGAAFFTANNAYFSFNSDYGTYINSSEPEESVLNLNAFAFSGLIGINQWKMRFFASANWIYGLNRKPGEMISLRDYGSLAGFRSPFPRGTSVFSLNVSAVVFNPFEWIGFRISPVIFAGAGMAGDDQTPLGQGKVYKGFGAGIAVTNVYLVNSSFRIFFGYYPDIKSDPTRLSSFEIWDFSFSDFEFGKPEVLEFEDED